MTKRNNELLQRYKFLAELKFDLESAISRAIADKKNQIELSYQRKAYIKNREIEFCYQQLKRV